MTWQAILMLATALLGLGGLWEGPAASACPDNPPWPAPAAAPVPDIDGYASLAVRHSLLFDGDNDYVRAPYFDPRSADGTQLSACMWVRWDGVAEWLGLQLYTPERVFWLGTSADYPGRLRVVLSRDGGLTKHYVTTEVVFDGTWRHVGFSFGSGVLTVLIDGQAAEVTKLADGAMTTINAGVTSEYVLEAPPGETAAVVICPRALSAGEMTGCMSGDFPADARAVWAWQEATGQVVEDASGSGNDGLLGGTPGAEDTDPAWVDHQRLTLRGPR